MRLLTSKYLPFSNGLTHTHIEFCSLRAIVRSLLATGTPGLAFFIQRSGDRTVVPTAQLDDTLARARSLYGAGLGFASLGILAAVVRATIGTKWEEDGDMADALAVIDADIAQAIQSATEEIEAGQIGDLGEAREAVSRLRSSVEDSYADVQSWGGEFPFERAFSSMDCWKF